MSNKPKTELTRDQWEAKGAELFGDDREAWRFVCPACGNVASIELARKQWPELEGRGWSSYQECVGRYTDKVDCNWCSYGLFLGPVFVGVDYQERPVPVFDFDGKPFTGEKAEGQAQAQGLEGNR